MTSHEDISVPFRDRYVKAFEKAEAEARQLMQVAGMDWLSFDTSDDAHWEAIFGETREGLEELKRTLARRYHSIPRRRRSEREAVMMHYISVDSMLKVPFKLETVWSI